MRVVRTVAVLLLVLVTSNAGSHTLAQAQGTTPLPSVKSLSRHARRSGLTYHNWHGYCELREL